MLYEDLSKEGIRKDSEKNRIYESRKPEFEEVQATKMALKHLRLP